MTVELSYCVVNTNGRDYLLACLDAIERTHPPGVEHEILVLDNSSGDGSAAAVEKSHHDARVIALERRPGKAENDSTLLREARGRYCLLLNEDSELCEGATAALLAAMEENPRAGAAGAQLLSTEGEPKPCAWRLPGMATALAGALFLHRFFTVQSRGRRTRQVGWAQSSAMLVRREAAAEVGYLDPELLRLLGRDRLLQAPARRRLGGALRAPRSGDPPRPADHRPGQRAAPDRGVPPRPRPLPAQAPHRARALRGAGARRLVLPRARARRQGGAGHDPRRYLLHARQELTPGRGEGIREAAEEYNRRARIAP